MTAPPQRPFSSRTPRRKGMSNAQKLTLTLLAALGVVVLALAGGLLFLTFNPGAAVPQEAGEPLAPPPSEESMPDFAATRQAEDAAEYSGAEYSGTYTNTPPPTPTSPAAPQLSPTATPTKIPVPSLTPQPTLSGPVYTFGPYTLPEAQTTFSLEFLHFNTAYFGPDGYFRPPDDSFEHVVVYVQITNLGPDAVTLHPYNFYIEDNRQITFDAMPLNSPRASHCQIYPQVELKAGQKATRCMQFQVPKNRSLTFIFQPNPFKSWNGAQMLRFPVRE